MEERREKQRFKLVANNGLEFTVIEYATYRLESDMHNGFYEVENSLKEFITEDGKYVISTGEEGEFFIPDLNLFARKSCRPQSGRH